MTAKRISIGSANRQKVYVDPERRSTHLHIVGSSGMGKTKFLERMIRQDILANHGVCVIDPHGELYRSLVDWCSFRDVQKFRKVHLIDPSLTEWRTGFNPLALYPDERPLHRVDNLIEALAQVWGGEDSLQTPSIRSVLRAILTLLIENKCTLAEAFPLTAIRDDKDIREFLTFAIHNPILREVWTGYEHAAEKSPREFIAEFGGPRRRLFELLHDEQIREMLGQADHAIDFRKAMDDGDIILINLSENAVDESRGRALGALLVREMFLVAKRRDPDYAKDNPFYLYIDECAQYLTSDISKLLAQTRKFGLHAILSHQWLEQLRTASPAIYFAVMAIQNKVVFGGLADADANLLADELFRTEYDIEMPVELLIKPTVVGVVQKWLHQWSESESDGEVESESTTTASSESSGIAQRYDENGFPLSGVYSESVGTSSGTSDSSSTSRVHMRSSTHGESEAYVPEYRDLPSSVHSLENVRHLATVRLRSLPARHAIVKGPGLPSFELSTFTVSPAIVHSDSRAAFQHRLLEASDYALPTEQARQHITERVEKLQVKATKWRESALVDDTPDEWRG